MSACCAPGADHPEPTARPTAAFEVPERDPLEVTRSMIAIPGGDFWMGSDAPDVFPDDGEGPVREVTVDPFRIDAKAVTNSQFATFVKATGYVTEAERFGWSFVFMHLVYPSDRDAVMDARVPGAPWWLGVTGADWRHPFGPSSSVAQLANHPAVHASWTDAAAYARWAGKRLPTEAEWERAARGGLDRAAYPWGDEFTPRGKYRCNTWQGEFPRDNTGADGFLGTAPVDAFRPNDYGLYNTSGNVWEWCADWFSADWHAAESPATRVNPPGPSTGSTRVMRGGSYLCHVSYCNRYRVAARTHNTPDSASGHLGFRCAADEPAH